MIVGPCAAGKSTLAAGLRNLGYEAMPVAQEHSDIPALWRHAEPDLVVALDVDLPTIRARRAEEGWPEWLYQTQRRRLQQARAAAALIIDAGSASPADILARVAQFLQEQPGAGAELPDQLGEKPEPA